MPTKTSERWIKDGDYIKSQLEAAGYKVNLQYANDDIPTQVTQLQDMITKKNGVLVVASIDGTALKGALADAKADGIPVIAYDRLLRDTDAVAEPPPGSDVIEQWRFFHLLAQRLAFARHRLADLARGGSPGPGATPA